MGEYDEYLKEFLLESMENLEQLDQDYLSLEKHPDDAELLGRIFRCIHTIKGTCGFFGFSRLEGLAHAGENLLSKLRDGELALTAEMTDGLLQLGDAVRAILVHIEQSAVESDVDYSELIGTLTALLDPSGAPADAPPASEDPGEEEPAPVETSDRGGASSGDQDELSIHEVAEAAFAAKAAEDAAQTEAAAGADAPTEGPEPLGEILVKQGSASPLAVADALAEQAATDDPRHIGELLVEKGAVEPQQVVEALKTQRETGATSSLAESTIRVDVEVLDTLMTLVGELVLARNQTLQFSASSEDRSFVDTTQRLNIITTELQEAVMKTRMQPIHSVWGKFSRIVRDMSQTMGKKVKLVMEGEDTELDRTILEAIRDPLTHIVRNSVDHGIESPAEREAAGKPAEGTLLLRAYHEGGQVNIEISDDGGGINIEAVKRKAIESNVISPDQAANMRDREIANLVFAPGFSTAKEVTKISGRGVGMDVVKTNIEKIGGTVDLSSVPGEGTTIRTKIPLTLAIIPALIVTCAGNRYAIPQVSLLELVRLDGEDVLTKIEMIQGCAVYRLRGKLLPLVYLRKLLYPEGVPESAPAAAPASQIDPAAEAADTAAPEAETDEVRHLDVVTIVVLQVEDQQFGLIVDSIQDTEEIVVKPLSRQLKDVAVYAGAAIMGDGRVAVILDVTGIAQSSHVLSELQDRSMFGARTEEDGAATDNEALLLFTAMPGAPMAIPLETVARLERFDAAMVEEIGGSQVVQYRGQILPLFNVAAFFGETNGGSHAPTPDADADAAESLQVLVCTQDGRLAGLVVQEIIDICEDQLTVRGDATRPGVLFTAVVQDRVTEFIDVEALLAAGFGPVADEPAAAQESITHA